MPPSPNFNQPILDGARRALARYGWEGTTLERIAEEAGVSRVTLHRRRVTKEGLLEQLAQEGLESYRRAMWPALFSEGVAAERLERAFTALCLLTEEHLDVVRALDARTNAAVFHAPGGEALTRSVFTEPFERLLRDGLEDGTLSCDDPAETATVLFNLVARTYVHLRAEHRWPPPRAGRAVVGIALDGVRRRM